ncbi:Fe2+-dependent dioxygenase [Saccharophagus degradans]|uniref:PKHD-type hydroxylase Sde_2812 n=1 Tax=Saccharophagus degradans (strain 2-40 / ATCC 43961 / DSM 17024) TaxID=203122 RepID=Y2812_SACD2|nr:Fe2+-dependent dioxygenase [Saccharophagus degradans]Q21GW0.1 RecName: Full=PKHD-type hydroxylase Sde_2812 [Saccharophagus degradans 2-40]ABD82069.1 2OG-Fe(II) oxygenase [Saccharophagus degradans 2-40]
MLLKIPNVLSKEQVETAKSKLLDADWADGNITAGYQSAKAKNNLQLPENSPIAIELGDIVLTALAQNNMFMSAALPLKIFPPLFNCYQGGRSFGVHVDNAIRQVPGTPVKVRTDISMTLFLSEPDEYEGGELVIEDTYGSQSVKLAAGDMVLYPATSLHSVTPVTKGRRLASFFWLQSMVNSDEKRTLLFDMDMAIQSLRAQVDDSPEIVQLTGVYHNLLRQWAQT